MTDSTLDVLHLIAPGPFGGLERVVWCLAVGQQRAGHRVRVGVALEPGQAAGHWFPRALHEAGVAVVSLEVPHRGYRRERALVTELCRSDRPHVVHTHGYRPDVLHAPMARRLGIATVSTVHGFTGGGWKNRLFELLDRRSLRRFDGVAAVSAAQVEQLRAGGVPADRLTQIPNAWMPGPPPLDRAAARAALGLTSGEGRVIGWVGRVRHEKGPDVLLEALSKTRSRSWTAVVVGDGPDRAALEQRAAALGIDVRWAGVVPDAAALYRAFDVFVLSSRTEGIPIVLFEAMHAGVPIVATRVGGVPEVVGPAEALLVPSEDAESLAAALDSVVDDPAAARERVRAAQERLEQRFALEPWLRAYDALYRRAMARRPLS